ncbi:histone H2B-like [Plodia interpunctella]|uniref:histone H2B-like n=1 Tax=Plodia interpunctella TaxID=58824 RepID=UPI002368A1D0|nr:histone H2B-like [Plodia interpunctella]
MPKTTKVQKPKPPLKSMEKQLDTSLSKMKKKNKKKKNYQNFSLYIYKLLKTIESVRNLRISRKSMLIMNNFVNDMLEKIALEAGRFLVHGKMRTMGSREVESSVKLLLPGDLAKHANIEGMKAVKLYHHSIEKRSMNSTS